MWIVIIFIIILVVVALIFAYSGSKSSPRPIIKDKGDLIHISWNPVEGAKSYIVSIGKKSGVYDDHIPIQKPELTIPKQFCRDYYVSVRSISGTCESPNSPEVHFIALLPRPIIKSITRDSSRIVVNFETVPGIQEYVAQASSDAVNYQWTSSSKTPLVYISIPSSECKGYHIRGYFLAEGCRREYSIVHQIGPSLLPPKLQGYKDGLISWAPQSLAISYDIWLAHTGNLVKVGETKESSYRPLSLECDKTYKYQIVALSKECRVHSDIGEFTTQRIPAPSNIKVY